MSSCRSILLVLPALVALSRQDEAQEKSDAPPRVVATLDIPSVEALATTEGIWPWAPVARLRAEQMAIYDLDAAGLVARLPDSLLGHTGRALEALGPLQAGLQLSTHVLGDGSLVHALVGHAGDGRALRLHEKRWTAMLRVEPSVTALTAGQASASSWQGGSYAIHATTTGATRLLAMAESRATSGAALALLRQLLDTPAQRQGLDVAWAARAKPIAHLRLDAKALPGRVRIPPGIDRLEAWLARDEHGDHETVRVFLDRASAAGRSPLALPAWIDGLAPLERGLGPAASVLPADTIAACQVALRAERALVLSRSLFEWVDPRVADDSMAAVRARRIVERLAQGRETIEMAVAIVAPHAGGSPGPEPLLLVRLANERAAKDLARPVLLALADALAGYEGRGARLEEPAPSGPVSPGPIRLLGHGERQMQYLRLAEYLEADVLQRAKALFGGGFVCATGVGEWLVVGCNPRTVRALREAVAAGSVLRTRPDVAARLADDRPHATRRLTACVDLARLRGVSLDLVFLPLAAEWIAAHGSLAPDRLARESASLLAGGGPEHFCLDVSDDGYTVRHEGGMALSPIAWATIYYACRLHAAIADVRQ